MHVLGCEEKVGCFGGASKENGRLASTSRLARQATTKSSSSARCAFKLTEIFNTWAYVCQHWMTLVLNDVAGGNIDQLETLPMDVHQVDEFFSKGIESFEQVYHVHLQSVL